MAAEILLPTSALDNYKEKEDVWFDDGREERLLEYVKQRLSRSVPANPSIVIDLIDEFGINHNYMMNVGAKKGAIVAELIAKHKPDTMIELGGYVGYSTILFAAALRDAGGCQYISFEREPKFASVAAALVQLAGLADVVRIVVGSSSRNLVAEHAAGRLTRADLVFLDHYKPAYVNDLKIMESLGLIKVGSVLAADNVIEPGNPTYLDYVRSTTEQKQAKLARENEENASFPLRALHQYKKDYQLDETKLPGLPRIVYESRTVHSYEPTGVPDGIEITECKHIPV